MASGRQLLIFSTCVVICSLFVTGEISAICYSTTIKVNDSYAQGGAYVHMATDVGSCEATCAGNSSCFGFDWDRRNNSCLLTMKDTAIINYSQSPGVDHYILLKGQSNCDASCSYPTWNPIVNVHTSGADGHPVASLDRCVLLCIRNSSCISIDWDPDNPSGTNCWIQSKSDYKANASNVYFYAKQCSRLTEISTASSLRTTSLALFVASSSTSLLSRSATTMPRPILTTTATSSSSKPSLSTVTSSSLVTTSQTSLTILSATAPTSSWANNDSYEATVVSQTDNAATTDFVIRQDSTKSNNEDKDKSYYNYDQWAIRPTYVVLVGVGGGCLLLALTAVVVLCQYPLLNSGESDAYPYSSDTVDSSDNIIDFGIFDTLQANNFPLDGVIATEFEAPAGR